MYSQRICHSRLSWIIHHVDKIDRLITLSWIWSDAREGRSFSTHCVLHWKHLHEVLPEIRS